MNEPINKKEPLKKKAFPIHVPEYFGDFEKLYFRYLMDNGVKSFYKLQNKYSRVDYLITSATTAGDTCVVVEHKKRYASVKDYCFPFVENNKSVYKGTSIIEVDKFRDAKTVAKLLDCPAYYICEYDDAVLMWQLGDEKDYKSTIMPSPKSQTNDEKVLKDYYYLNYSDASYIIGTRKWQRASYDRLEYYINQ